MQKLAGSEGYLHHVQLSTTRDAKEVLQVAHMHIPLDPKHNQQSLTCL